MALSCSRKLAAPLLAATPWRRSRTGNLHVYCICVPCSPGSVCRGEPCSAQRAYSRVNCEASPMEQLHLHEKIALCERLPCMYRGKLCSAE